MKSVLVITPFIWEGGPWRGKRTVYAILEGFQRAGYQVHVVTATNRLGLYEDVWEGLHIHYFHPAVAPGAGKFDAFNSFLTQISRDQNTGRRHLSFRLFWLSFVWGAAQRAGEIALAHPPTFLYGINNLGIPPAWWVARKNRIPFFARIMGSPIMQWIDSPIKLYIVRFDELLAFKLPSQAIIVTDDGTISTTDIHDYLGIPRERIWLLRNGIDKSIFQQGPSREEARKMLELPLNAPILLWVSQLVNWKHPERLLQALPVILSQYPETFTVILGDGPLRSQLESLSQELGIAHSVRFDGFVAREKLPVYFHAADIFTAFYDYANIGNSTLEAMLCGLPVVALDNGHTADVVHHGENGFLIPPDQLDRIAQTLLCLVQDTSLRRRLGQEAAQRAGTMLLTWEERIDKEIAMIEAAL